MTVLDQVVVPAVSEQPAPASRGAARRSWAWLGLVPFAAYVLLFLALPTVLAVGSGFVGRGGAFTLDNVAALGDPLVLSTFANSAWVSLVTAVIAPSSGPWCAGPCSGSPRPVPCGPPSTRHPECSRSSAA